MVSFTEAFGLFWSKYADFDTKSTRAEYWWWQLWEAIIIIALSLFTFVYGLWIPAIGAVCEFAKLIFELAVIIPNIALSVRRLHDIGRSGWWWFMGIVPVFGWIVLLVFYCTPSQKSSDLA